MQISRKADYALRAMVILAGLAPGKTMQAQEMASAGTIPIKFLEQILLVLKRAGLLQSKRGVGGGYRLGKEPRLISVGEIIELMDGELCRLVDSSQMARFSGSSGLVSFLEGAETSLNSKLRETSIEDILTDDAVDAMVGYGI